MESRRTGAPSYDIQAKAFITTYVHQRKNAVGHEEHEVIRNVHSRALKAREDYKALVLSQVKLTESRASTCDAPSLSKEEK